MDSNGFRNVAINDYVGIAPRELDLWARSSLSKRTFNIPSLFKKTTKFDFSRVSYHFGVQFFFL
jgi:hypothetical protein